MAQCWIRKDEDNSWRIYDAPEDYPEIWIQDEQLGEVVSDLVSEGLSVLVVAA